MSRLNFTGRKKILRKDVRAEVNSEDGKLELTAKLSRTGDGGYEFPGDAQIIIEATIRLFLHALRTGNCRGPGGDPARTPF